MTAYEEQRARWVFIVNNYATNFDYRNRFQLTNFKIRRVVWGREVGENGTRHLQGYLELLRSYRKSHVLKIFSTAYWAPARGTSLENYLYCTKDNDFETVGDFSRERCGHECNAKRPLSVALVISSLLDSKKALQVKVTKEYADRHFYYDKIIPELRAVQHHLQMYREYSSKKLYPWQYECLKLIMNQNERQVLWVVDFDGNRGKTFLASYLSIMYSFKLLDGTVTTRDLTLMVSGNEKGFCFDISRSSADKIDYATLEALKNGVLSTGKYYGKTLMFKIMPVVLFANSHPQYNRLSVDRWRCVTLGEAPLDNLDKFSVCDSSNQFPFLEPPPLPDLSEDFDCRAFVSGRAPHDSHIINDSNDTTITNRTQLQISNSSQVAGPPTANQVQNFPTVPDCSQTQESELTPSIAQYRVEEVPAICSIHGGNL